MQAGTPRLASTALVCFSSPLPALPACPFLSPQPQALRVPAISPPSPGDFTSSFSSTCTPEGNPEIPIATPTLSLSHSGSSCSFSIDCPTCGHGLQSPKPGSLWVAWLWECHCHCPGARCTPANTFCAHRLESNTIPGTTVPCLDRPLLLPGPTSCAGSRRLSHDLLVTLRDSCPPVKHEYPLNPAATRLSGCIHSTPSLPGSLVH